MKNLYFNNIYMHRSVFYNNVCAHDVHFRVARGFEKTSTYDPNI